MSSKEKCIALLDTFTEAQLEGAQAMLQAMRQTLDDLEDDMFCEQLYKDYLNDPDKGDPVPIEECAKELGIEL